MSVLERVIAVIAPHSCVVCSAEGSLLCAWCFPDACPPVPERCFRCKKSQSGSKVCISCRKGSGLHHVWVRTDYGALQRQLIHLLKFFERTAAAAKSIARLRGLSFAPLPARTSQVRQVGSLRAQRLKQLKGVFRMTNNYITKVYIS